MLNGQLETVERSVKDVVVRDGVSRLGSWGLLGKRNSVGWGANLLVGSSPQQLAASLCTKRSSMKRERECLTGGQGTKCTQDNCRVGSQG